MKTFFSKAVRIVSEVFKRPLRSSFFSISKITLPSHAAGSSDILPEVFMAEASPSEEIVKVGSAFKLVFITVVVLTLISLFVSIILAFQSSLNEQQKQLFESCTTIWKIGSGAIIGLIGGKAS